MKKGFIGLIAGVVIVVAIGVTVLNIDFNRLNKETYYVQVTQDGILETNKLDNGEVVKTYNYKLAAVNEKGKLKDLDFTATKNLKIDAYLKLYVKNDGVSVSSYDEVKEKDLPKKVKENIN